MDPEAGDWFVDVALHATKRRWYIAPQGGTLRALLQSGTTPPVCWPTGPVHDASVDSHECKEAAKLAWHFDDDDDDDADDKPECLPRRLLLRRSGPNPTRTHWRGRHRPMFVPNPNPLRWRHGRDMKDDVRCMRSGMEECMARPFLLYRGGGDRTWKKAKRGKEKEAAGPLGRRERRTRKGKLYQTARTNQSKGILNPNPNSPHVTLTLILTL